MFTVFTTLTVFTVFTTFAALTTLTALKQSWPAATVSAARSSTKTPAPFPPPSTSN
jgi:hypothetical protein